MPDRFMLDKNEQAIICGFHTEAAALRGKEELEKLGVIDVKISNVDFTPLTQHDSGEVNALTGNFPGLASSIYDAELGDDSSVLLSAGPDASGFADRATNSIGRDVVLTVVVDESKLEAAHQILAKHGALI